MELSDRHLCYFFLRPHAHVLTCLSTILLSFSSSATSTTHFRCTLLLPSSRRLPQCPLVGPRSTCRSCDTNRQNPSLVFIHSVHRRLAEFSEQPTASQGTPPTKTSVVPAPITILSFSHSNKPVAMSDLNSACISAIGVKLSNGTANSSLEDTAHPLSAPPTLDGAHPSGQELDNATVSGPLGDVDPQIVEALRGKDRIYVLKLGEMMESLIDQRR